MIILGAWLVLTRDNRHRMRVHLLIELYIGEVMIQIAVASLVSANMRDHVSEAGVAVKLVVLDSLIRRSQVVPVLQVALVDLLQKHSVSVHGLLFKIADQSMARGWSDHVHQEVEVEEASLAQSDDQSVQDPWVAHLEEEEEVHALIFGLLKQMMDPAVVTLERSQAS